jgi:hypothetical protein
LGAEANLLPGRTPRGLFTRLPTSCAPASWAIACGYEDAYDLDHLRSDPALKLACGHLPDSGRDLCSQPTMSRWEDAPSLREVIKLMRVMVALYCASHDRPPASVSLDIDDTLDVVHGQQQRCGAAAPGKTPSGREIRGHLRRLVRATREHWPHTHITIRGDSHYGRPPGGDGLLRSK